VDDRKSESRHDCDNFLNNSGGDQDNEPFTNNKQNGVMATAQPDNNNKAEDLVSNSSEESASEAGSATESSCESEIVSGSSSSEEEKESSTSSSEEESDDSNNEQHEDNSDSDGDVVFPPVYEGCSLTVDEGVLEMMNLYLQHSMEKTALGDTLRSTLKFLPQYNGMPKSQHALLKYVSDLCPLGKEKVHFYCSVCHFYLGEEEVSCSLCGAESRKFYQLSLADQIKNLFENHGLADEIDKYAAQREAAGIPDGTYSDLCDGSVLKNVKVRGSYNLTLVGHTDGLFQPGL